MCHRATLTNKAAGDIRAVSHNAASRKDKVPTDHSVADPCGTQHRTIYRAILQHRGPNDRAVRAHLDVGHKTTMLDLRTLTDSATIRPHRGCVLLDERRERRLQLLVVTIHRQHICGLSRQNIADRHLTTTRLVEHLHEGSIAKGGLAHHLESCYVVDDHIVTDVVMRDAVPHAVDDDSIADGTIDQLSVS